MGRGQTKTRSNSISFLLFYFSPSCPSIYIYIYYYHNYTGFISPCFLCGLLILLTQHVCRTLRPVLEENGILEIEVPDRLRPVSANTSLWPGLPLDGWLGWPGPINRLVVFFPNRESEGSG